MTDKQLHTVPIPEDAQTRSSDDVRANLATNAAVAGGSSSVEDVSLDPDQIKLAGEFRGRFNDLMAADLRSLFGGGDVGAVPLYGASSADVREGYYALERVSATPSDPRATLSTRFDGVVREVGTKRSHWRAVETAPQQPEGGGNDFGSGTTSYVAVPAASTKRRWYNPVDGSLGSPTLVETRNGAGADVEIYDSEAASFDDPVLIYEVDYSEERLVDCLVFDDRGVAREDADGVSQWRHVFDTKHDYAGVPHVSNGLIRLDLDESNGLSAETWDDGTSSWTTVSLGTSDWSLWDVDIQTIGLARVDGQLVFEDSTDGSLYYLNFVLHRGYENVQFFIPVNESGPVPSGLQDLLTPIANTSVIDPHSRKTLVERSDVAR